MLCSIDMVIDWGNPYGLTSVVLLIDLGNPTGSRTSFKLVNLVTGAKFKLVL